MVSVLLVARIDGRMVLDHCDDAPTLGEAVEGLRVHWCEGGEDEPAAFLLADESGRTLASMLQGETDPEVCITTYADGTVERHRCHYVLDADGMYCRTEVTELAAE